MSWLRCCPPFDKSNKGNLFESNCNVLTIVETVAVIPSSVVMANVTGKSSSEVTILPCNVTIPFSNDNNTVSSYNNTC